MMSYWGRHGPNVTSLLTLIIIGLSTFVRSLSQNRERGFLPLYLLLLPPRTVDPLDNSACGVGPPIKGITRTRHLLLGTGVGVWGICLE